MSDHRIYHMTFASIYDAYINKVSRKGQTETDARTLMCWQTGYSDSELQACIETGITLREFFENADNLNERRFLVTGVICGVRIEALEDPLMKEIRIMDKIIDELAKGKALPKIMRDVK